MIREEWEFLEHCVTALRYNKVQNGSNIAIINHTSRVELVREEFLEMIPDVEGARVFCHSFEENAMGEAYAPFLSIIKDLMEFRGIDHEELIEKVGIYPLHEMIFKSYFVTGMCTRMEEPLFSEVKFEKQKIIKGIVDMLVELASHENIYIVLNRLNYAGASTWQMLDYIISTPSCGNIKILGLKNENAKVRAHEETYKNKFDKKCEKIGCVYEWSINSGDVEEISENGFTFKGAEIEDYLITTRNLSYFYAFADTRYFLDLIYEKVQIENVGVTIEQKRDLYMQLATLAVLQGDCSHALLISESLHRLYEDTKDWRIGYDYEYVCALVNMHNGNMDLAEEYSNRCIKLAIANGDTFKEFKGRIAKIMSRFSGFHNILISFGSYYVDPKLLEQCVDYGYYNILAHIYVYCFENESLQHVTVDNIETELPYFIKGIEIGEKLGNDQFLMDAYRTVVMLSSYSGKSELVNYFYSKDIAVARRCGDTFEEGMVYNGLGYNCCTTEEYLKANEYFNQALKIFHGMGLSDYIIETLYNMAINAFMAGDYKNAAEYLEKVLYLLNINRKNSLRVCNISKVFGLIALAYFHYGHLYGTRNYIMKDAQFLDYIVDREDETANHLWDDDLFLYFICQGFLSHYSGNYEEALKFYESSELYMNRSMGNYFLAYPQYCLAKQATLKALGREEERVELLQKYKKFCQDKNYKYHYGVAEELLAGTYTGEGIYKDKLFCSIIDEVCEAEKIRSIEREANSRRKEIQFFSLFQNLLDKKEENIADKMKNVLAAFASNYNLDGIVTIHFSDKGSAIYRDKVKKLSQESVDKLVKFFEDRRSGFVVSKYNGSYKDYRNLFSMLFEDKVFSIVGVPVFTNEKLTAIMVAYTKSRDNWNASTDKYVLNDYDLEIYTFIFRQIINAMKKWHDNEEIERMNKLLKQQAVTDELTGIFNRQGYYSIVRSIISDPVASSKNYAFIYLDLDHFKYYNDTFGHNIGDAILISFANIFRKMAPEDAYVIRLGGDEFAIIMTYEDKSEVRTIAENILDEIQKAKGFSAVVQSLSIKAVSITKENYAGCSIGIAYTEGVKGEMDFEKIRKNSDIALYYVKEHGRNSYKEFES